VELCLNDDGEGVDEEGVDGEGVEVQPDGSGPSSDDGSLVRFDSVVFSFAFGLSSQLPDIVNAIDFLQVSTSSAPIYG